MGSNYADEVLYREYLSKMDELRNRIDETSTKKQTLLYEKDNFNHIDRVVREIIENMFASNRDDLDFLVELDVMTKDLDEVKFHADEEIKQRYEEYEEEEMELRREEESVELEYRQWMKSLELESQRQGEDEYED